MKNHKWVDGKLLQTNKKYAQLKLRQKEKIYQWMYESYRETYQRLGRFPIAKDADDVLSRVFDQIDAAGIWIPEYEVSKHYSSIVGKLKKRLENEGKVKTDNHRNLRILQQIPGDFSVCKVTDYSGIDLDQPFCFTGRTDDEKSLVCPVQLVPVNTICREDGWKALRFVGELDFSLIGVLSSAIKPLSSYGISVFAISTFNTDYILVKEAHFDKALTALKGRGFQIEDALDCSKEQKGDASCTKDTIYGDSGDSLRSAVTQ